VGAIAVTAAAIIAAGVYAGLGSKTASAASGTATPPAAAGPTADTDTVQLSDSQLGSIKTAAVTERDFPTQKEALGKIDFNQDMNVPVFTPYQARSYSPSRALTSSPRSRI
jgi:cobalt-zinc-cadmium efflux system membrane fusion protein